MLGSGSGATTNDAGIVSPEEADRLDRKADDGNPESGTVLGAASDSTCVDGGDYNTGGGGSCALALQL